MRGRLSRWASPGKLFATEVDREKMVSNEKLTEKWKLRGLKLRGLRRNQISTPDYIYQNDHRKKINTLSYFVNPTPMHMGATHASSKIDHKF